MAEQRFKKHLTACPHCGRDVLDHMAACPFCKGELIPRSGKPMAPEQLKRLKLMLNIVGFALAVLFLLWRMLR